METISTAATPFENITSDTVKSEVETKPDKYIWGIYIFLCIVSIIELYSASSREVASAKIGVYGPVLRHIFMLAAGCGIMLLLQRVHYRKFRPLVWAFALISVVMMLYVMFFGEIVNGARRSFNLCGVTIQPSEFLKLSAVLVVALLMSKNQIKGGVGKVGVMLSAGAIMLFGGLLIKQGMTNTLLLMGISLSMMIIGGVEWSKFFKVLFVYMICCGVFYVFIKSDDSEDNRSGTWKERIERFVGDGEPKYKQEINAKNRQEMFSYMAQANGGVFGVFPGNSRETARLPLAFSDFIYAIIIEDTGLVGGILILVAYMLLLGRANAIASKCSRVFPALLVMGLAVMIAFQALFHMAIVSGFFPVSGQPLPLISKGGTSILITSIALGMMLSVSRFAIRNTEKKDKINEEINALPEDIRAANPTQL
ncbi:MAG: FtsW/RodA/SpoVE family cell cycle protein [Bacteroidales bacterium]|nr:FtsW/RodA/SpoVE family cell cycle protein [Bacteroidales bacterium]MBD5241174.1 FtsW/RodA/SpoVE family cell cycle protein [Barnesiella sp.]MDE5822155.1 FtsW/RodA/SpoVE family cell cycle protein [Paramuribaculum sp.]